MFAAGSAVKNPPAMRGPQETRVQSLGRDDPLEEGMAAHSRILAWRIPWTEEPGRCSSWGRRETDMPERLTLSLFTFICDFSQFLIFFQHVCMHCCCSIAKSCLTLCDPMDCNVAGFPVLHQLLEFAQTHVPWGSDAIQPSHPLSPPSPSALSLSQHQGLFQWGSFLHQVVKVLELQHQHPSREYSGLISFRIDWFGLAVQGTLKSLL